MLDHADAVQAASILQKPQEKPTGNRQDNNDAARLDKQGQIASPTLTE